jgi:hypothetical protein
MMNMIDNIGEIRETMHKELAALMAEVYWDMIGNILLKNAWQKTGYDWFEGVVEEEGMDGNRDKDNDDKAHDDCNDDDDNEAHDNGDNDKGMGRLGRG